MTVVAPDQRPLVVYDRIDVNRRNTRILIAAIPVLLLPFAAGIAMCLSTWRIVALPVWLISDHPAAQLSALFLSLVIVMIVLGMAIIVTIRCYQFSILKATRATRLQQEDQPELWRVVENLSIGAGLPQPALYLVDSPAPNAFATGTDPARAWIGVTTGLLKMLDRRELEGVIAHELSHIGNRDTRLSVVVAAVVATLRLPVRMMTGIYWYLTAFHKSLAFFFTYACVVMLMGIGSLASFLVSSLAGPSMTGFDRVWGICAVVAPFYVFFGAPVIGLCLRQTISQQREFLADADAVLLTRDPEALGLALTKIGAWEGLSRLNIGLAAAHLCIADPVPSDAPWWDKILPCHPPVKARVDLLARMGTGIPASALEAAANVGEEAGFRNKLEQSAAVAPPPAAPQGHILVRGWIPAEDTSVTFDREDEGDPALTIVYEKPDGLSTILTRLPEGTAVSFGGTEGNFFQVVTADRISGYIARSARPHLKERDADRQHV